jgi:hypothetical protein
VEVAGHAVQLKAGQLKALQRVVKQRVVIGFKPDFAAGAQESR